MKHRVFPFCACPGQERAKEALLLNLVNPAIGGVLISGEKGTAKSTLVRGAAELVPEMRCIDLPLNISEDRLFGSIDMEKALHQGEIRVDPGILQLVNGGILYVDEVNLLSPHIANGLLEASSLRFYRLEREGLSMQIPSRFLLVGTMNPEEGRLGPQILDRFGLYVEAKGENDTDQRIRIIEGVLAFEQDPTRFRLHWSGETKALSETILRARKVLKDVEIGEGEKLLAAHIASEAGCAGHRAELVMMETARAAAALEGRRFLIHEDIHRAASYALPHRLRHPDYLNAMQENANRPSENEGDRDQTDRCDQAEKSDQSEQTTDAGDRKSSGTAELEKELQKGATRAGQEKSDIPSLVNASFPLDKKRNSHLRKGARGRRKQFVFDMKQGRYCGSMLPKGELGDIAFDASLRAAVMQQRFRDKGNLALKIEKRDLRVKRRERRTGLSILFLVDASGSMGARRRMGLVKGTIISLLKESYEKRDQVALVAFRGKGAELLLPLTRSVELAEKLLRAMPTGGKTPLAAGLFTALGQLRTIRIKDPDARPLLVLVSDGRANQPFITENAMNDAMKMAEEIGKQKIRVLVMDCESGYVRLGLAQQLAQLMGGECVSPEELTISRMRKNIERNMEVL